MNKLWLVLIIVFLLLSACSLQNRNQHFDWKEFVSDEGGFKIAFPGIPQKSVEEFDWMDKKIPVYRFPVPTQNIRFEVRYSDYADAALYHHTLQYFYDYQRDQALELTNAKLISESDIWLNENSGREIVVIHNKQIDKYRFYKIGNHVFQLNTSNSSYLKEDAEVERNINKFLDSFQLIEE